MKLPAAIPILLIVACLGCDREGHRQLVTLPEQIVISKPTSPTQRFLTTNSSDVAFDTKSGSLCRTWDWRNTSSRDDADRTQAIADQTSTCAKLYDYDQQQEMSAKAAQSPKGERTQ